MVVARSEESRQAIIDATLALIGLGDEHPGMTIQKLTIESIARRAGVSKATIYRWWPNKAAVVLDAFAGSYLSHTPIPDGLPVTESLAIHVKSVVRQFAGDEGRVIAEMIAEAQYDSGTMEDVRARFWSVRAQAIHNVMDRGIHEGVFRVDLNPILAGDIMYAPIYFRLLMKGGPLDDAFADELASVVLRAFMAADR